jgi:hypothetical protein
MKSAKCKVKNGILEWWNIGMMEKNSAAVLKLRRGREQRA